MNHLQNAIRLGIVAFWLFVIGVVYSVYNNVGNASTLGWSSLLLYGVFAIVVLYAGAVLSKKLWSVK